MEITPELIVYWSCAIAWASAMFTLTVYLLVSVAEKITDCIKRHSKEG